VVVEEVDNDDEVVEPVVEYHFLKAKTPNPWLSLASNFVVFPAMACGLNAFEVERHLTTLLHLHHDQRWALVALGVVLVSWLNSFLGLRVSQARQRAGIPYPLFFPDKNEYKHSHWFQAVLRSHQNMLEYAPLLLAKALLGVLMGGVPTTAGLIVIAWVLLRVWYHFLYSSGKVSTRGNAFMPSFLLDGILTGHIFVAAVRMLGLFAK